jgi:1-acyl-sn-glycerol-3-phosphate acyltransferase
MKQDGLLPTRTQWLYGGFAWYAGRMIRKHFDVYALEESSIDWHNIPIDVPVIVYANHPSWWDPLVAVTLHEARFGDRGFYAPIDAEAIKKYEIFRRLGFYPLQLNSRRGAVDFLERSKAILNAKSTAIWLTPEGRFTDARDHAQPLMPGLAHLVHRIDRVLAIPLALEYVYLNERKPCLLMRLAKPVDSQQFHDADKATVATKLEDAFRENQRQLAELVVARSLKPFSILKQSPRRPGNMYDISRTLKSWLFGRKADLKHEHDQ